MHVTYYYIRTLHPLWFEDTHSEELKLIILIEDNCIGKAFFIPLLDSALPSTNNITSLSDVG